jgi:hypothetical protein
MPTVPTARRRPTVGIRTVLPDKGEQLEDKPIEHRQCIDEHGLDLPESRDWKRKGLHRSIRNNILPGE